jgi:hypothetical protein
MLTNIADVAQRPVYYRLPRTGETDPFFNFSRAFYYVLEKRGHLKFVRICGANKKRGVTLIPYAEVEAFIAKQGSRPLPLPPDENPPF